MVVVEAGTMHQRLIKRRDTFHATGDFRPCSSVPFSSTIPETDILLVVHPSKPSFEVRFETTRSSLL